MRVVCALLLIFIHVPCWADDVLIIESYSSKLDWNQEYVRAIRNVLEPKHSVQRFQMETDSIPKTHYKHAALNALDEYRKVHPKVVILGDDNALVYMLPLLYQEPISIVFLGINDNPRQLLKQYHGRAKVTGVLERPYFIKTIGEIAAILPLHKRKLLILFDAGTMATIARTYMQQQYQLISEHLNLDIHFSEIATERVWQRTVLTAKQHGFGAILIGIYHNVVDSHGRTIDEESLMSWTSQFSPVPVFGLWNFSVGKGRALGGVVISGGEQGRIAAEMALDVLDEGMDASRIPIQIQHQGVGVYSRSEIARWGLKPPKEWVDIDR
jgi:hypothetical protein